MIQLFLGVILLVIPFILLALFFHKSRGFVCILFFLLLFHTFLAVITQAFGIFYYWLILAVSVLVDLILLAVFFRKRKPQFKLTKIDWVVVLVIAIAFLSLWQVHYNYTGKINLATDTQVGYHEVKNMEYVYPYFSDEWYAISLIKHSINSHDLPLWNDLNNTPFLNLEMFFHSLVAEVTLIFGLEPLTQYVLLSIFFNVLLIVLAYIFLRLNNVSKLASAIASLSILYITCGANLPGIWNFIPVHLGIIFCLIGFCFMAMDKPLFAGLSSIPVIIFYGPLFIFYGLALLVFWAVQFKDFVKKHWEKILLYFLVFLVAGSSFLIILMLTPLNSLLGYIFSRVFYTSLYGENLTNINLFYVVPFVSILLLFLGIKRVFEEKKWLAAVLGMGIVYWIFYSFTIVRFVIEYERAVFFTSIIVVIISGFGLEQLKKYLEQKYKNFNASLLKYAEIAALILFLLLIPFYTQREGWRTIILTNIFNGAVSYPKAPANNYLTEEDLEIFEEIKGKKFLSIPWKGTVIGIATDNYPVVAKAGTLSAGQEKTIDTFLESDCEGKKRMAKNMNLDYVYLYDFNCPGFEKMGESLEGITLYKTQQF